MDLMKWTKWTAFEYGKSKAWTKYGKGSFNEKHPVRMPFPPVEEIVKINLKNTET